MQQIRWFDRKFQFDFQQNIFPAILERLEGTIPRMAFKIKYISPKIQNLRVNNTWSIKENIGHLIDLEPLWQNRLTDILEGKEFLREADLKNKKTDLADHNKKELETLFIDFQGVRKKTLRLLEKLSENEVYKFSKHPRLLTPMRTMDLFLFVAEHDDHHLARITEINKQYQKGE